MQIVTKEFRHSIIAISFSILLVLAGTSSLFLLNIKHVMAPALITPRSQPTSNIVNTKASYEILFTTSTAGSIKTITVAFPTGFSVGSAILIEGSGIGAGGLSVSGTTLTYSVSSPVNIPAGIPIRLDLANIIHPSTPGTFLITITTKDSFNVIDGPTSASTFITQIGNAAIANGAVTSAKIGTDQVGSTQIANGAVTNPKIAANSVTSSNIAHGAVSISSLEIFGSTTNVPPGAFTEKFAGPCPVEYVATGGGFNRGVLFPYDLEVMKSAAVSTTGGQIDEWLVAVFNHSPITLDFTPQVVCTKVIP